MTETKTGKDLGFDKDNPFYDTAVVSTYTDEQAVDDGVLVDLGGGHRATRNLYDYLNAHLGDNPPSGWAVPITGKVSYFTDRAAAALVGLLDEYAARATAVYEENIGGGIFKVNLLLGDGGVIAGRNVDQNNDPDGDFAPVWLIPNGAGVTAMFPEDY